MAKKAVVTFKVDGQLFGIHSNFHAAYQAAVRNHFELTTYKNELKKLSKMQAYKIIACKRAKRYHTVEFCKQPLNQALINLVPMYLN
ncbi:hypothetical protein [Sunxiuqinia elliptica]|uniref:Uncharacterized protein n=1 Tax=Sunxiuqinia elliptica TaxID=655355 RepID=A0A4R6GX93_9BACT|nr:hypothetical protein [Sunxiuqinia elliptica]TDN99947.1 hypothetical protein DET52_106160 [Sunxiuqinia elliptica]TDO57139.1 hypothetical protein DET65_3724 [Sunxiuqinia elliptica]